MKRILLVSPVLLSLLLMAASALAAYGPKVTELGNKHNLSSANTSVTYKADANDPRGKQICIFCHTPHNAVINRGLWNRFDTTQTFGQYSSTSLTIKHQLKSESDYNEPNGSSRLCLSCHDGVTALGAVVRSSNPGVNISINSNPNTVMAGNNVFTRNKVTNSHHPISFNYAKVQPQLATYTLQAYKPVPPDSRVKLDSQGRMQCNTCHDPHQTKDDTMKFWVWDYVPSPGTSSHDAVCLTCHEFIDNPPTF